VSRAHERMQRLLVERLRLGTGARRVFYTVVAAIFLSGMWWLGVHYGGTDEIARVGQESVALKVHGAAAFVAMLALGAMGAAHVRRAWVVRRNRFSGLTVATAFALLVVSGYALYYLVDEITRPPVSILHWIVGLALVPMLVVHIATGRRSQALGGLAERQRQRARAQTRG